MILIAQRPPLKFVGGAALPTFPARPFNFSTLEDAEDHVWGSTVRSLGSSAIVDHSRDCTTLSIRDGLSGPPGQAASPAYSRPCYRPRMKRRVAAAACGVAAAVIHLADGLDPSRPWLQA